MHTHSGRERKWAEPVFLFQAAIYRAHLCHFWHGAMMRVIVYPARDTGAQVERTPKIRNRRCCSHTIKQYTHTGRRSVIISMASISPTSHRLPNHLRYIHTVERERRRSERGGRNRWIQTLHSLWLLSFSLSAFYFHRDFSFLFSFFNPADEPIFFGKKFIVWFFSPMIATPV
jgi:hypothetical protein